MEREEIYGEEMTKITATKIAADIIRWAEAREEELEQERKRNDELATKLVLLQEQHLNLQAGIEDGDNGDFKMEDIGRRASEREFKDLGMEMMQVSESGDVIALMNRIIHLHRDTPINPTR